MTDSTDSKFEFAHLGTTRYVTMRLLWTNVAWYRRLWAVLKVPYDLARLVIAGEADFGTFLNPPPAKIGQTHDRQ